MKVSFLTIKIVLFTLLFSGFAAFTLPASSEAALLNPKDVPGYEPDSDEEEDEDDDDDFFRQFSGSLRTKIRALDNDIVEDLKIPILLGVSVDDLVDTWGDSRSGGRTHEGIDIFAPRGMFVISPTEAVVTSTGFGSNGGNYVYTANPGGERFYYAHLQAIHEDIERGEVLEPGDVIGYVGNTGNAEFASPHLHFTIYDRGAHNPFPRLTREFSLEEKVGILTDIVEELIEKLEDRD